MHNLSIIRTIPAEVTYSIQLWVVAGGTADAGDYSLPTGVFLFDPEEDSITVPITITGDDQVEPIEDFYIQMREASSVAFIPAEQSYRIFIQDDDEGMKTNLENKIIM